MIKRLGNEPVETLRGKFGACHNCKHVSFADTPPSLKNGKCLLCRSHCFNGYDEVMKREEEILIY